MAGCGDPVFVGEQSEGPVGSIQQPLPEDAAEEIEAKKQEQERRDIWMGAPKTGLVEVPGFDAVYREYESGRAVVYSDEYGPVRLEWWALKAWLAMMTSLTSTTMSL
ncbi:MAG: hypothetical protein FWD57_05455 [Polyangiaceae bacterium]|nr:hypothetical protein [Polyangiaceae bacterium]